MNPAPVLCGLTVLLLWAMPSVVDAADFRVDLANDLPEERVTSELLQALAAKHDLSYFLFTDRVKIDARSIPHSHPVLTLHARHRSEPDLLLSTFLHEQLHWFCAQNRAGTQAAIESLRVMYPSVPLTFPEGAKDAESVYLHLLVNRMEYLALESVIGSERANDVFDFWKNDHYTWIYAQVMENPDRIDAVIAAHGLDLPHSATARAEEEK